jgi:hypothetical protein
LHRSTNLSKNRKSAEPLFPKAKELGISKRADAGETSGGHYQEINIGKSTKRAWRRTTSFEPVEQTRRADKQ